MGVSRNILKEANSTINEISASYYNRKDHDGKLGQLSASFTAETDSGEEIYNKVIDWCDSIDELLEYAEPIFKDFINFIDNSNFYIERAEIIILGVSEVKSSVNKSYKPIKHWVIYENGNYTGDFDSAKSVLA